MLSQIISLWLQHRVFDGHDTGDYNTLSLAPSNNELAPPTNKLHWMLVFCFPAQPGSGPARERERLFHDYQPSSGPTALTSHFGLDLIRSISVNHRVSMSTVTCRAWFCKTSLQSPPPNTHTQPNPLTIFPFFLWWCSHHLHHNPLDLAQSHSLPIILFSFEWHIQNPHDLWLWVNFTTFLW